MFWPFVLPLKITLAALAVIVAICTVIIPRRTKWKRYDVFSAATLLAIVAVVPSCTAITAALDLFRFGTFAYDSFDDIHDFRAQRYMPPAATNILMQTYSNGYRARYNISEDEFTAYLDDLWDRYGKYSRSARDEYNYGVNPVSPETFEQDFGGLNWPPLQNATLYHSPMEDDGGGATYYFDAEAGIVYQRNWYW